MISSATPMTSSLPTARARSLGSSNRHSTKAKMPIGKLTKKHHCQLRFSVIQPPRIGPAVGPTSVPAAKNAWADPCRDGGKSERRIVCEVEISPPPPTPCTMRQKTKAGSDAESPHIADARVKIAIDPAK